MLAGAVFWALIWAGAFVATKAALRWAPPPVVVSARCIMAGGVLLAAAAPRAGRPTRRVLGRLALLGMLNNAAYLGLMAYALPSISAGTAAILSASTPLLVVCTAAALGQDKLTATRTIGLALGFAGIAATSLSRLNGADRPEGVLLGVVAVLALATGTLLTPRLTRGVDAATATGWQAIIGGAFLFVPALLTARMHTLHLGWQLAGTLLFLGVGASVLGMTLWLGLIRWVGPTAASLAQFMPPLLGIALGHLLLGEPITTFELLATLPVAVGITLALRRPPRRL
ncbi:DMT family transporter [Gandjariella thermophila]|uniref:DMT family transporter n=1 Tax=Gandjariella thermophila TaxID=1931992 RepID=UPI0018652CAC|nr:DMT family transporter [Gandjariella thermophila]